jgi:hypothetical protein
MDRAMNTGMKNRKQKNAVLRAVQSVYRFYRDGFQGMVLGRKLWKIILIKLFVMFVILKLFFFPDFLHTRFKTDEERGNYVLDQITRQVSLSSSENLHQPKTNFHLSGGEK